MRVLVGFSAPTTLNVTSSPTTRGSRLMGAGGCLSESYEDIEFVGNVLSFGPVGSLDECQLACTRNPGCQFYTYYSSTNTESGIQPRCYLQYFTNQPSPAMIAATPGAQSGFSQKDCCTGGACVQGCTSLLYPNIGFSGTDVGQVLVSDAESCRISCTQSPDCKYFTFYGGDWNVIEDRYTCHMKSSFTGSPDFISLAPNATSGFPINATTYVDCSMLLLKDSMFTGTLVGYMMAPDALQCQHLCTQNPLCQFFTHFSIDWMLDERR
ncbi:plasma kallikrein [Pelobates cultripes]|uniref:Plasma kallikrein n=1 Tax=Pelobates cultripes TaxID=61616 RepID=A0AAD1SDQ8_PELCU|nr:plasma kallikrein [Pelobates cultripes]